MRIIILLLNLIIFSTVFGQRTEQELTDFINKSSQSKLLKESSFLMIEGYYYDAEKIIDKLLVSDPENCNYNYRKGYVLMFSRDAYSEAIPYLEKASKNVRQNFDVYKAKEKSASVDAIYYLGVCYHYLGKTDKATAQFNDFKEKSNKDSEFIKYADLRITQCKVGNNLNTNKILGVSVKNLGENINSSRPEYSGVVSLDGSALYFTARRPWGGDTSDIYFDRKDYQFLEDIYVSKIDRNGQFNKPERLGFCNPGNNEATISVVPEENKIYTFSGETGNGDIYYSDLNGKRLSIPKLFEVAGVNTEFWEPHFIISPDGKSMYVVSNREGGLGGRDIYELTKLSNGEWSAPVNMGPGINSEFEEDSPFVSADGKHFFFASNGPKSMGGFDIMYSKKESNGTWSESKNIGSPLNSYYDDMYYSATASGNMGFYTSAREGGFGEKDIYGIDNNYLGLEDISFLKAKIATVNDVAIPESFRIVVTCLDCATKSEKIIYPRQTDGMAITGLEPCKSYDISYQMGANNKEIYKEKIQTECNVSYSEVNKEYLLDVPNEKFVFPEVPVEEKVTEPAVELVKYFAYNKNSVKDLAEFKNFMKQVETQIKQTKRSVTILIYSSASTVPTTTYKTNENLADLRAENAKKEIVKYCKAKGIDLTQINIDIMDASVNGPTYEKDAKDTEKYAPFQFVKLAVKE